MSKTQKPKSWRDVIKVHPAADLFPMMSPDELTALGEDIKKNRLQQRVTLYGNFNSAVETWQLLDGRNRLDAMELVGVPVFAANGTIRDGLWEIWPEGKADPYEFVLSANVHRRHLTAEQKREIIVKVLKARPEKSNRTIAKQTKVDDKTVGSVRRELEGRAEIPHVSTVEDTKGRKQPSRKRSPASVKASAEPEQELPLNDVEAAENATAQFLYELGDLDEEFDRITDQMVALGKRLCASLDMREGETFADFMRRLDPEHGDKSDKPQVLIAEMACALLCVKEDDLHFTIEMLDQVLAKVLEKRSASAAQSSSQPEQALLCEGEDATIVWHSTHSGTRREPVRHFEVKRQPYAQYPTTLWVWFVPPRHRRRSSKWFHPCDYQFFTIERNGRTFFDSREHVACNMDAFLASQQKHKAEWLTAKAEEAKWNAAHSGSGVTVRSCSDHFEEEAVPPT